MGKCFSEDRFHKVDFGKEQLVSVRTSENSSKIGLFWIKGIVEPKILPNENDPRIYRKIKSHRLESAKEQHFISSGITLRLNCVIENQYPSE